jgi:hypothetical protein
MSDAASLPLRSLIRAAWLDFLLPFRWWVSTCLVLAGLGFVAAWMWTGAKPHHGDPLQFVAIAAALGTAGAMLPRLSPSVRPRAGAIRVLAIVPWLVLLIGGAALAALPWGDRAAIAFGCALSLLAAVLLVADHVRGYAQALCMVPLVVMVSGVLLDRNHVSAWISGPGAGCGPWLVATGTIGLLMALILRWRGRTIGLRRPDGVASGIQAAKRVGRSDLLSGSPVGGAEISPPMPGPGWRRTAWFARHRLMPASLGRLVLLGACILAVMAGATVAIRATLGLAGPPWHEPSRVVVWLHEIKAEGPIAGMAAGTLLVVAFVAAASAGAMSAAWCRRHRTVPLAPRATLAGLLVQALALVAGRLALAGSLVLLLPILLLFGWAGGAVLAVLAVVAACYLWTTACVGMIAATLASQAWTLPVVGWTLLIVAALAAPVALGVNGFWPRIGVVAGIGVTACLVAAGLARHRLRTWQG